MVIIISYISHTSPASIVLSSHCGGICRSAQHWSNSVPIEVNGNSSPQLCSTYQIIVMAAEAPVAAVTLSLTQTVAHCVRLVKGLPDILLPPSGLTPKPTYWLIDEGPAKHRDRWVPCILVPPPSKTAPVLLSVELSGPAGLRGQDLLFYWVWTGTVFPWCNFIMSILGIIFEDALAFIKNQIISHGFSPHALILVYVPWITHLH